MGVIPSNSKIDNYLENVQKILPQRIKEKLRLPEIKDNIKSAVYQRFKEWKKAIGKDKVSQKRNVVASISGKTQTARKGRAYGRNR